MDKLDFEVIMDYFDEETMSFVMNFENQDYVSQGYTEESLRAIILDNDLIYGDGEYESIAEGTTFELSLPRMANDEGFEAEIEVIEYSIDRTTNTVVLSQLVLTLVLSVSLKHMWHLLCVMQVLALLRNYT